MFYFRYYKKVAVVKEKQKRNEDEDSIEDVDDEEFENMIGNLIFVGSICKAITVTRMNLVFGPQIIVED